MTSPAMKIKSVGNVEWPQDKAKWSRHGQGKNAAKHNGWSKEAVSLMEKIRKDVKADQSS